jgi:hypothetical protein
MTIAEAIELVRRLNATAKGDMLKVIMPSGKTYGDTTREELDEVVTEIVEAAKELLLAAGRLNGVVSKKLDDYPTRVGYRVIT